MRFLENDMKEPQNDKKNHEINQKCLNLDRK